MSVWWIIRLPRNYPFYGISLVNHSFWGTPIYWNWLHRSPTATSEALKPGWVLRSATWDFKWWRRTLVVFLLTFFFWLYMVIILYNMIIMIYMYIHHYILNLEDQDAYCKWCSTWLIGANLNLCTCSIRLFLRASVWTQSEWNLG